MKPAFFVSSLVVAVSAMAIPTASAQNSPTKLTERVVNAEAKNQKAIATEVDRDPKYTARYGARPATPAPTATPTRAPVVVVPARPGVVTPAPVAVAPQRDEKYMSRYGRQPVSATPPAVVTPSVAPSALARPGTPAATLPVASAVVRHEDPEMEQRIINFQRQNAISGNPSAQYDIGMRYLKGDGLEQDRKLAKHWLQLAAENGNSRARKQLAELKAQPDSDKADEKKDDAHKVDQKDTAAKKVEDKSSDEPTPKSSLQ